MTTEALCPGLLLETQGSVLTARLDRPDGNLISREMCWALSDLLARPPKDAHVLILTGAGESFCLGRERKATTPLELGQEVSDLIKLNQALTSTNLVTLAKVNGSAAGFGVGLASLCDIAVTLASARFSFPEVTIGLAPTIVLAWLQQAVGRRRAFELTATGRQVAGNELMQLGLVNDVVDSVDELEQVVADMVADLSRRSPRVHSEIKSMLRDSENMSTDQAYALSSGRLILGSMLKEH